MSNDSKIQELVKQLTTRIVIDALGNPAAMFYPELARALKAWTEKRIITPIDTNDEEEECLQNKS